MGELEPKIIVYYQVYAENYRVKDSLITGRLRVTVHVAFRQVQE